MKGFSCQKCGTVMSEEMNFCPICGTEVERCPECETRILPNATFCTNCGYEIIKTEQPSQENLNQEPSVEHICLFLKWTDSKSGRFFDKTIQPLTTVLNSIFIAGFIIFCLIIFVRLGASQSVSETRILSVGVSVSLFFCLLVRILDDYFKHILLPRRLMEFLQQENVQIDALVKDLLSAGALNAQKFFLQAPLSAVRRRDARLFLQAALALKNPTLARRNYLWFALEKFSTLISSVLFCYLLTKALPAVCLALTSPSDEFFVTVITVILFNPAMFLCIFNVIGLHVFDKVRKRHVTNIMRETANTTNF